MKNTLKNRIVSVMLLLTMLVMMIPITSIPASAEEYRATKTETLNLFNSGLSGQGKNPTGSLYSDAKNPAPTTFTNNGYDIYVRANTDNASCESSAQLGLSFTVEDEVAELATLTINAYDVDESDGEQDGIYLVDLTSGTSKKLGLLKGMNEQWNTTTFRIDKGDLKAGHTYAFRIKGENSSWCVYVRTVALQLTTYSEGGAVEPPQGPVITSHAFSASISNSGTVSASLSLTATESVTYTLEFAASINGDQRGSSIGQSLTVTPEGTSKDVTFQLQSGSPKGTYQIDVIVKDAANNAVVSYTTTAGYAYSSVRYDANGGSTNLPLDTNSYSAGATATVLFDYIPSRAGYKFLGWSADKYATAATYTPENNRLPMESSDVTLYAVWEKLPEVPIEPTAPTSRDVLIIRNDEPWSDRLNYKTLFADLQTQGRIGTHTYMTPAEAQNENFSKYGMIYVIADMGSGELDPDAIDALNPKLEAYAAAGGVVLCGNCPRPGTQNISFPGGVKIQQQDVPLGYVVDSTHPIVTGVLTDGTTLLDSELEGNRLSYAAVDESTLPEESNVILRATTSHAPLLAEYALGNGRVIVTTMSWIFYYQIDGFEFSTKAYDDLILYAISLSGGVTGCPHTPGEWIVDLEPTCENAGRKHAVCTTCTFTLANVYIPALGHKYETSVTQEVTCTTPGILTHTCIHCSDSYATYVYSEHTYEITEHKDATCEEDGYNRYTCSKCQDTYDEIIEGGHEYEGVVTKIATKDEDGLMSYTCKLCQHAYTEVIPARPDANVLLVQDRLPWSESTNVALLNKMQADGYITGWDLTTTANFANVNLAAYNVILIANDQSTATYDQLNLLNDSLVAFATAGGVVIYGACDHGWAGGNIGYSLPEGVNKKNFYSHYNYIVDSDHFLVSGILTDGKALTNNLLYGNYCSHTAFDKTTLPENANIILQDGHGDPTLVEYGIGNGHVILSGLTWEFYYTRSAYGGGSTTYTKNVYDDLIAYALYLSDPCEHAYDEGTVVAPTCTMDGYTLHECAICGATMKDTIVPAVGHGEGAWVTVTEPTELSDGLRELRCPVCEEALASEIIPALSASTAKVECDLETVIIGNNVVFTLVIGNCPNVNGVALVPVFDTNLFELVDIKWQNEGVLSFIEQGTNRAVLVFDAPTDLDGQTVFSLTLKAIGAFDYTAVGFTMMIEENGEKKNVSVVSKTVSLIECPHTDITVENLNDQFHMVTCSCGHVELVAHEYDDACDTSCNLCDALRDAPHAFIPTYDENAHTLTCDLCGKTLSGAHEFGQPIVVAPTCLNNGYTHEDCAVCGYSKSYDYTDKGDHVGEWVTTREPTAYHDGERTLDCEVCFGTYTETIAAKYDVSIHIEGVSNNLTLYGEHTFIIRISGAGLIKSMALTTEYDTSVFSFVSAEWLVDALLSDIEGDANRAVATWDEGADVNTKIFALTLYAHTEIDFSTVRFTVMLDGEEGETLTESIESYHSVVNCTHENREYVWVDEYTHGWHCTGCGDTQYFEHSYPTHCETKCQYCGYERVAPHLFDNQWTYNESEHWHTCIDCGAESEHIPHSDDGKGMCPDCSAALILHGDADNDGDVDADDALYVVYHVFFGEGEYPTEQSLDYDGNGIVDSDDAVHLLYYIFFGAQQYPLS